MEQATSNLSKVSIFLLYAALLHPYYIKFRPVNESLVSCSTLDSLLMFYMYKNKCCCSFMTEIFIDRITYLVKIHNNKAISFSR